MLDLDWIVKNKQKFEELNAKRGLSSISDEIAILDQRRRQLTTLIQQLRHGRKEKARTLGFIKDKNSKEFDDIKRDASHINDKLEELQAKLAGDDKLIKLLETIPNLLDEEVPYGKDESMNEVIRTWGTLKDLVKPREHFELGEGLRMMDFVQTAKISGSRFVTLKGNLARLERALINFMLDIHTSQSGYVETSPPLLVRNQAMYGVGQLPKFSEDSFETTNGYRLIPTGEVPLTNMVADTIINRELLPIRMVAYTPCFRSEAGSAGRDTKGMFRLHQFGKVELVSITTPQDAKSEHEYLTNSAEEILKQLELPYRVVLLCSGDTGFSAKKTYDIEVWLPGQQRYREISSCSNCGDFQARRMKARYKEYGASETTFVHTLNGSALAIGRTIIAIMENYQNADGSITIPKVLVKYMNGLEKIERAAEFVPA